MKFIFITILTSIFALSAHAAPAPTPGLVQTCSYDLSVQVFEVIKRTVGLHRQEQLQATYDICEVVCVERQGLARQENLDAIGVSEAIHVGLKKAMIDVFQSEKL